MTDIDTTHPRVGLDQLGDVELTEPHRRLLEQAEEGSAGPTNWRRRKADQARRALALSQVTPRGRLRVLGLGMTEDIHLMVHLNVTVPCMGPDRRLVVLEHALLAVRYPQRVMMEDLPGTAFVQIQQPSGVWHANCDAASGGLCLGRTLPRNVPLTEILWLSYTALAMQTWMFDERDAAGVLNAEAARWWAVNRDRLPLTGTALLEDRPLTTTGGNDS